MLLRSCRFGLVALVVTSSAFGLPTGITNGSCGGCHTASVAYDGSLSLVPDGALSPNVATQLRLRIEESHMLVAGFFVYADRQGSFTAGPGNRASAEGVVHSRPVRATDGVAEVTFTWTPPSTPGGLDMFVYVVASDDSGSQTGDIAAFATFPFVWGCEGVTLYEDIDGDGYGGKDGAQSLGCEARPGFATNDNDCNDLWASIHPGAKEVSNNKDDDCNGIIDDGIVRGVWYEDKDGDGYGALATEVQADVAPPGFVGNSEDCDDSDPDISPEGVEVCDGRDNDCNRAIDDGEGVYVYCGIGICRRLWETCETECVPGSPMAEVCNGLDDDCDGDVDEDVTCSDGSPCRNGSCGPAHSSTLPDADPASNAETESNGETAPDTTTADAASVSTSIARPEPALDSPEPKPSLTAPEDNGGCRVSPRGTSRWLWLAAGVAGFGLRRRSRQRPA